MFTFHIPGSCMYVLSKSESLNRGHLEISFQLEIHPDMQTPDNFCRPVFFLPPLLFYSFFLLHTLPPSVSGIVHVFTSKVIVPDLYDRPLTLRVLVHQHQAEKHPRACVSRTKSGSLSFNRCNLQLECTPTNHIYSCTVKTWVSRTRWEMLVYIRKYTFTIPAII